VLVAGGFNFSDGALSSAELYGPAATPTPTPTCVEPPPQMVSWWPGDGNANDIQGNNNGSLQNGATFVAGKVSQAFSLDGLNDFVAIPHNNSLNPTGPFSVDLWVNASAQQSESLALIIDKSHGWTDGSGWGIQGSASSTCFFYGTGANSSDFHGACTPTGIFDGQWHHLAGVWTGTAIQIYQDAVLKDTLAFSTLPVNNTRDVHIGMSWGGGTPNRFFHGMVDEAEYFNRALTAAEIQAIYDAGSAGKCKPCVEPPSGMVSWWPGDGNALDIQNGNNGTLQNGAAFATGEVGQAFTFDGVNDFVEVPDDPSLRIGDVISIEF